MKRPCESSAAKEERCACVDEVNIGGRSAGGKIGVGAAKFREKRAVEPSNVLIFASRSEIITVDAAFEPFETAVPR
ncbi:MAG: hypothetical protein IJ991_15110 [Thermoguttaceae bacterium]|nr:hypothetical protein [Thermoguttaceae bacterium]